MSECHWCDEGRPFLPGLEGIQHVPLFAGGEHGGAMCYRSPIYRPLDAITDVVLAYKANPKSKAGKKRKRKEKRENKT